jgi:predicted O-methyltransferase YrrM
MSPDTELDKRPSAELSPPLRMLGDREVGIVLKYAVTLPEGAEILEVGPWLGGLTRLLAQHGRMTVVDRFIWTDANAENYPGIAAPEGNFRALFEANMKAEGITPRIIETTLPEFEWPGGALDFVMVDAPRTVAQLHGCLKAIAPVVKRGAYVLVKHALNRRDLGLGSYIDALIGLGFLRMVATEQPNWCNIVVLAATDQIAALAGIDDPEHAITTAPMAEDFTDPWYGRSLSVFRLAYLAQSGRWSEAYARLSEMPASSEILTLWDEIELLLQQPNSVEAERNNAILSELVWIHNDCGVAAKAPIQIGPSFANRLRAYWLNNAKAEWVYKRVDAKLICDESAETFITSLSPSTAQLFQKNIVEVGNNLGGGALAAVLAGAQSYTGVEMSTMTELAVELSETYPNVTVTQDIKAAIRLIQECDMLLIGSDPEINSPLADAVTSRVRAEKNTVYMTRLSP